MTASAPRIVSLLPSATEIVAALGHREHLVGRSHECDHPAGVEALPVCSRARLDVHAGGARIDRAVRDLVRDGLSVYEVLAAPLRDAAPDVVVTQTQCEVCAVTPADVERALADWLGERPRIVSLAPDRLEDVWADIGRVGDALGTPARAATLVDSLRARMQSVAARAARRATRPRVACIEWMEPLMAAGNWMPELVAMAGGENLFGEAGAHSPWLEWETLAAADPEVIVVMPCGYSLERCRRESGALTAHPSWPGLRAARTGRVYLTDGHQFFNRPGPRLADSLEILAHLLHPDDAAPAGGGWARL